MRAFRVYVNNRLFCTAGIGKNGVLATILSYVAGKDEVTGRERDDLDLEIGGLIGPTGEQVRWRRPRLKIGDQVRVRIIDADSVDKPRMLSQRDPVAELRAKKKYVRNMAKELGWAITTRRSKPR